MAMREKSDAVEDLLHRELEQVHGGVTPVALVERVANQLPEDVDLDEARAVAERLVDGENAVADNESSWSDPRRGTVETSLQNDDSAPSDGELSSSAVRDHYRRAAPALEAIATVDGAPTIGVSDYTGWYIKQEHDRRDSLPCGYTGIVNIGGGEHGCSFEHCTSVHVRAVVAEVLES